MHVEKKVRASTPSEPDLAVQGVAADLAAAQHPDTGAAAQHPGTAQQHSILALGR